MLRHTRNVLDVDGCVVWPMRSRARYAAIRFTSSRACAPTPLNGLPAIEADVLTGILRPVGVLQQPRKTPGPQRFLGSATRSTNAGRYGGQPAGLSREYPVALFKSEAPI